MTASSSARELIIAPHREGEPERRPSGVKFKAAEQALNLAFNGGKPPQQRLMKRKQTGMASQSFNLSQSNDPAELAQGPFEASAVAA